MKRFLIALIAFLSVGVAHAGTLGLHWDPSTAATGYMVGVGDASGVYGPPVDVGNQTATTLTAEDNCTKKYYAVLAYNEAGQSDWSEEVVSEARPVVVDATVNAAVVHRLQGKNFSDDVQVLIDGA